MAKRDFRSREILRVIGRRRAKGIGKATREPRRAIQVLTRADDSSSAVIPSSRTAQTVRDPRDWTMFAQSTLPPPRVWARSLGCARDDGANGGESALGSA